MNLTVHSENYANIAVYMKAEMVLQITDVQSVSLLRPCARNVWFLRTRVIHFTELKSGMAVI